MYVCHDFVLVDGIDSQREIRSEHKHTDAHDTKRADQEEGGAEEGEKDRKKKREIETSNKRSSPIISQITRRFHLMKTTKLVCWLSPLLQAVDRFGLADTLGQGPIAFGRLIKSLSSRDGGQLGNCVRANAGHLHLRSLRFHQTCFCSNDVCQSLRPCVPLNNKHGVRRLATPSIA